MAGVESKPEEIAALFIAEHGIDRKYQKVLTKLINDQISKFKTDNQP